MDSNTFLNEMEKCIKSFPVEAGKYVMAEVSWDDVTRHTDKEGKVTEWGDNISDSRLFKENNEPVYYIRPENLNEKIAKVNSRDIYLLAE